VRGAVRPEKEARVVGRGRLEQRLAVPLALQQRQAVEMRPQPAAEHRRAIQQQVLRSQRRAHARAGRADEVDAGPRGDMLEDDPQPRVARDERGELALDEYALAIVRIDVVAGRLAVQLQDEVAVLDARERRAAARERRDARIGMRRRARRVALHADESAVGGAVDLGGRSRIRQVQGHQRLEMRARGQRREDAVPVRERRRDRGDRRLQVRHHDGAGKCAHRRRQHGGQLGSVPQVQVPVVRTRNRQCGNRARQGGFVLDPRAPQTGSYRSGRRLENFRGIPKDG
jgi:hypothetical protein